jgi:hypothetical protein
MPTVQRGSQLIFRSLTFWYVMTPMLVFSPQPVTHGKKRFVRSEDQSIRRQAYGFSKIYGENDIRICPVAHGGKDGY